MFMRQDPSRHYLTRDAAASFLRNDFMHCVIRTKRLYVGLGPRDEVLRRLGAEEGYFEPLLLSYCWMDFLGKLRQGADLGTDAAIRAWIRGPMESVRTGYRARADALIGQHRDSLVHQ